MPAAEPLPSPLDAVALARVRRRLNRASQPPWLHQEAARRMAERLPVIRLQPDPVLDWAAFLGASHALLRKAYPRANVIAVEDTPARRDATTQARRGNWWSRQRRAGAILAADVAPGQAQLLWSNMALHLVPDARAMLASWQRALAADGFLMFSTLGPGSLGSLRELYAAQRWAPPFAPFVDMHDIGDMLIEAGFADPVMDQETVTLTWSSPQAAVAELRAIGGNAHLQRCAGLRTPRWRERLLSSLAAQTGADGRIALDVELVYGHAFKPAPRVRLAAETRLPLDELRAMVRRPRPGRSG